MLLETPSRLEPTAIDAIPGALADRIADLIAAATKLDHALPTETAQSLADVVRVMNCYYSNLIEGHNTRLKEIEAALDDAFDEDAKRRSLQVEARAHIRVQAHIDEIYARGTLPEPASVGLLCDLHRRFYDGASEEMLRIGEGKRAFQMTPGVFREHPHQDNLVGRHQPPSSERVAAFMGFFEERFRLAPLGTSARVIAIAIAHHRLNYIHPFDDGNGRVSRLMSHAMGLVAGIGAHGLWSISRGLARGLSDRGEYKRMMDLADTPRQGDLDGRGNLSQKALIAFVEWFIDVALDQIRFMTKLFDLEGLGARYERYIGTQTDLRKEAFPVIIDILKRGPLARGEVGRVAGLQDRTARTLTRALLDAGLVGSATEKSALTLRFPRAAIPTLFPDLYTAQALT